MSSNIIPTIPNPIYSLVKNETLCLARTMVGYGSWPNITTYEKYMTIRNKTPDDLPILNIIHHLSIKVVVIKLSLAPSRTEMKCVFCGSELGNDIVDLYGIKAHRSCFEKKLHQYLEVKPNE